MKLSSWYLLPNLIIIPLWIMISLVMGTIAMLLVLLPLPTRLRNRWYFGETSFWNTLYLATAVWRRPRIIGKERLPKYPHNPAIIVMNHPSALDACYLEDLLGSYPRVWIVKEEMRHIPIIGWLCKRMHILVPRNRPRAAIAALITAIDRVKNRSAHLLIFPEGTRQSDRQIGEFLTGFAIAARKLQRPVIPIAIIGTSAILPKKSLLFRPLKPVTLVVGPTFLYNETEDEKDFTQRVRTWFIQELQTRQPS